MSTEIINVLNYICEKIGIAIDWTSDNVWPQVMDILGRYRILQVTTNSMWCVVSLCMIILFVVLWIRVFKSRSIALKERTNTFWWEFNSYYDTVSTEASIIALVFATLFICGGMIALFNNSVNNLLTWLLVPEIKYLDMLKTYIN